MSEFDQDIDLAQWDEVYSEHDVTESKDFDSLPDGRYQVEVASVELTVSKAAGNPMLAWELTVLGPRHIGRKIWRNNMMISADNIKWLKQDLWRCGLKLTKLSDLKARLEELLDIRLDVSLKTKRKIQNVFFDKLIPGKGPVKQDDVEDKLKSADAEVCDPSDVPF